MAKLSFTPNVPVQIALKYPLGKIISGRWGEQMLFTLTDGRWMYVPVDVASKINMLEVNVNEPFCICKRWNGQRSQPVRWDVWLTPEAEKVRAADEIQNAETLLERQLRESLENLPKPRTLAVPKVVVQTSPEEAQAGSSSRDPVRGADKGNGNGSGNGNGNDQPPEQPIMARFSWAPFLLSQTQALTDVFAAALNYASKGHGNHIKPEDVRALMTTAFINLAQRGGLRAGENQSGT